MRDKIFEDLGYNIDYYINRKYIGSKTITEPDRDKTGYEGRREEALKEDIILKGKKYKKGTIVLTECVPLCGRIKGNVREVLERSVSWRVR